VGLALLPDLVGHWPSQRTEKFKKNNLRGSENVFFDQGIWASYATHACSLQDFVEYA
jgi:hypothetical protein